MKKTQALVSLGFNKPMSTKESITVSLRVERADDLSSLLDAELSEHQLAALLSGTVIRMEVQA